MSGTTWDGYVAPANDKAKVDQSLRSAWPPGTFDAAGPGHQAQPNRGAVYDAPPRGQGKRGSGKRPKRRPAT